MKLLILLSTLLFSSAASPALPARLDANQRALVNIVAEDIYLEASSRPARVEPDASFRRLPAREQERYRVRAIKALCAPAALPARGEI